MKLVLNKTTGPKLGLYAKPHVLKPLKWQILLYVNYIPTNLFKKEKEPKLIQTRCLQILKILQRQGYWGCGGRMLEWRRGWMGRKLEVCHGSGHNFPLWEKDRKRWEHPSQLPVPKHSSDRDNLPQKVASYTHRPATAAHRNPGSGGAIFVMGKEKFEGKSLEPSLLRASKGNGR